MNSKRIGWRRSLTHGRDAAFERGWRSHVRLGRRCTAFTPSRKSTILFGGSHRLERIAELRSRAEQDGVVVRTVEQHGDPAEIIELHANARGVDLIVMGADRTLGSRWLRRASIAERVLRRTTKPTLVVPVDDDAESGFGNLLVAADLSPASRGLWITPFNCQRRLTAAIGARGRVSSRRQRFKVRRDGGPGVPDVFSKMRDVSWRPSWQTFRAP